MSQTNNDLIAEARALAQRLMDYGQCHDGDVDDAAKMLRQLCERLERPIWRSPLSRDESLPLDPPDDLLVFDVPQADRSDDIHDIAEKYAVGLDASIPGGCIIYGLYRGEWHANVSGRWLVSRLIGDRR